MTGKSRTINKLLQPWWRLTRGQTLGAQGMVIDQKDRILLVRHGYRPGWHFPGGGVEQGESCREALGRELLEETGVRLASPPRLHGVFTNFRSFPGDHIVFYVIRQWTRKTIPPPNAEILEQDFFALDALPNGLVRGARNRIDEIFHGAALRDEW